MKTGKRPILKFAFLIRWGSVLLTLLFFLSLFNLIPVRQNSQLAQVLWLIVALGSAGLVYAVLDQWLNFMASQTALQQQLFANQKQMGKLQDRLDVVLKINSKLADADDENSLMLVLLKIVGDYIGASGASYVPLDEWGQPLTTVNVGTIPQPLLAAWLQRLDSPRVQQICKDCKLHHVTEASLCPLGENPFLNVSGIYCLELKRNNHVLGMLNFYLPPPALMDEETQQFLSGLLNEMAFMVETARLRRQELATLRQIQLVRNPKMELTALLQNLLMEAQQALETDYACLLVQGAGRYPAVELQGRQVVGELDPNLFLHPLVRETLAQNSIRLLNRKQLPELPAEVQILLVAPIQTPEGHSLGGILIANRQADGYNELQLRVVSTIAAQAALLIENDHLIQELEYKAVIDERTRLAREIHDGLAQTLAFLKMQVSQMQNYLTREDLPRLREVLHLSHKTLSDAYLDVRQAIDNLRVTPDAGLKYWLEQSVADFKQSNHDLRIESSILLDRVDLSPEIQAQLIRVVQEALSNIRKHAHASRANISLQEWQTDIILEISDNGQGFSPEDVPSVSQYGLRGMRERAEMIGADFQIVSQPDQGTTIRLRLPYPFEETPV